MTWLLRKLGFYKIEWGYACGRAFIRIDGKTIAHTSGDDVFCQNETVAEIIDKVFRSKP